MSLKCHTNAISLLSSASFTFISVICNQTNHWLWPHLWDLHCRCRIIQLSNLESNWPRAETTRVMVKMGIFSHLLPLYTKNCFDILFRGLKQLLATVDLLQLRNFNLIPTNVSTYLLMSRDYQAKPEGEPHYEDVILFKVAMNSKFIARYCLCLHPGYN